MENKFPISLLIKSAGGLVLAIAVIFLVSRVLGAGVAGSLILGALGWGGAALVWQPIREINVIRIEVAAAILLYGNLSNNTLENDRILARDEFHRLGMKLMSHELAAWPWIKYIYQHWLKWDIYSSGKILKNIGDATIEQKLNYASNHPAMDDLMRRLCLPKEYKSRYEKEWEEITRLMAADLAEAVHHTEQL
jgi:hypothetical protein